MDPAHRPEPENHTIDATYERLSSMLIAQASCVDVDFRDRDGIRATDGSNGDQQGTLVTRTGNHLEIGAVLLNISLNS
jgi:hypothetical protein